MQEHPAQPAQALAQGVLRDDQGDPVLFEPILELWRELEPEEFALDAPPGGDPAFLKALVQRYWPKLESPGAACATAGGRGALALSVRCFLEPGMALLAAAPYWAPYEGLAAEAGCRVESLSLEPFDPKVWSRSAAALMAQQGRLLVWLNEPCHHPTGRSLKPAEREALLDLLEAQAERGHVVVVLDGAYLDFTPDPGHVREALDGYAARAQTGPLQIGAALSLSKSMSLPGARGGALAFPWSACLAEALLRAEQGPAPRAPQALVAHLARDGRRQERLNADLRHWSQVLEGRAVALDSALRGEGLPGIAWQGGFFTTLPAGAATAESLLALQLPVAPLGNGLRVGLCALRSADAPRLANILKNAL